MFLHIGKDFIINNKDIIGIFNLEYIKNTKEYKSMYNDLNEKGDILNVADESEKSFILTENDKKIKGYITKIGVNTITKRLI